MNKNIIIIFSTIISLNFNILAQNENITINFKRNLDNSIDFNYEKKLHGSFYLNIEFGNLSNAYSKNHTAVVKDASGSLFKLSAINSKEPINFSYKYSYTRGVPNPKVDSLFTYCLPFKKGKTVTIFESKNLNETYFGSEKPLKWKSYSIDRASSDTICNMRKGIVVEIVNEFSKDPSIEYNYTSKMNKVVIEHEDGTFASYSGLKKDAIFTKLGQTVYPQTVLGTLETLNNTSYRLYFHIYYIIHKNEKIQSEFLTPYFFTHDGSKHLMNKTEYVVECDENILLQEFSKKEKKQYLKNPKSYL